MFGTMGNEKSCAKDLAKKFLQKKEGVFINKDGSDYKEGSLPKEEVQKRRKKEAKDPKTS